MERRYGRYTVVATLGSGGMGDVHRARDERLGRDVALKTVRNVAGLAADTFRARFDAEARALAALSHPAIVQVHDLGIEDDEPYLVMELVDGPSLKARIAEGPMSEGEVRAMGIQLARGLEVAHGRHILHRDIKPANILRNPHGQWKLADFGIARVPDSDLTLDGQFVGTPAYAAPEALARGEFSETSDVFSLAVTLVEAATGKRLRDADLTELVKHGDEAIVVPDSISAELRGALTHALARRSSDRPSAARFAELLAGAHPAPSPAAPSPDDDATRAGSPKKMRERKPAPDITQHVADETPVPAAPRPRNLAPLIAGTIVGLLGVGAVVAVMNMGGGSSKAGGPPATKPGPGSSQPLDAALATAPDDAAPAPIDAAAPLLPPDAGADDGWVMPPIRPGKIDIQYPPNMTQDASRAFQRVAGPLRKGDLEGALEALNEFEQHHGMSDRTVYLRAQILAHPAYKMRHR